jgi:cation:H+ antiporter
VDVNPRALRTPLVAMFGAGLALFVMTFDLRLSRWQGAFLLAAGGAYFVWDFWQHWRDRQPEHLVEARAIEDGVTRTRFAWLQTRSGSATQFIVGAAIVVLGSRFLVDGAINVAARLGIPSIIVGLTVVAIGTSLPELITAITSSRKSVSDLAVGNVLGANIANLTLVVGTAALVQDVTMDRLTQVFNFPAMLATMAVLLWMLISDRKITRREGVALLAIYVGYLTMLVAVTTAGHS